MLEICPLCTNDSKLFYTYKKQVYYQCKNCEGIFMAERLRLNKAEEKIRYELHNNDIYDDRYQKFVSPITSQIFGNYSIDHSGLDFGAGTGPVISKILKEKNYRIKQYDPYFHNNPKLLTGKYDYIACCEVIEHFYNPKREFALLKNMLAKNGRLYCMTEIYSKNIDFHTWYYKNDTTHVFLYLRETVEFIKDEFKFTDLTLDGRLITFYN